MQQIILLKSLRKQKHANIVNLLTWKKTTMTISPLSYQEQNSMNKRKFLFWMGNDKQINLRLMSLLNVIERRRNVGKYVYRAEHVKMKADFFFVRNVWHVYVHHGSCCWKIRGKKVFSIKFVYGWGGYGIEISCKVWIYRGISDDIQSENFFIMKIVIKIYVKIYVKVVLVKLNQQLDLQFLLTTSMNHIAK